MLNLHFGIYYLWLHYAQDSYAGSYPLYLLVHIACYTSRRIQLLSQQPKKGFFMKLKFKNINNENVFSCLCQKHSQKHTDYIIISKEILTDEITP